MYKIENNIPVLRIGKTGENEVRTFTFDVSSWLSVYPSGEILGVYRRPDGKAYPVSIRTVGNTASWTVTDTDLSFPGDGELELRIVCGAIIGKSCRFACIVTESIDPGATPPVPGMDWIADTLQKSSDAAQAATEAKKELLAAAERGDFDGDPGPQGEKGEKGDPGVDGEDYVLTDADKEEIEEVIIQRVPLVKAAEAPIFVDNIDEMTDTSKIYVLSDGFIYAHMTKAVTVNPTNQIPLSQNSDGTEFVGENGEDGYKAGYRLNSSGGETALSTMEVTGYIPAKFGDTLRFAKIDGSQGSSNNAIGFYDASFNILNIRQGTDAINAFADGIYSITDNLENKALMKSIENMAYIRVSAYAITADSVITVNEPLEAGTTTMEGWHNTGCAFIPADYEDRIIDLENDVAQNAETIASLRDADEAADYVVEEADRVAKAVYAKQNANTVSFLAISDSHYLAGRTNIENGLLHAGQGMNLVRKGVHIDFGAVLGDNGWGSGIEGDANRATIEAGIDEIRDTNKYIDESLRGIPNFRVPGNHDSLIYNYTFNGNDYLDAGELFPLYGAYNTGAIFQNGHRDRGYCYRDFEEQKLRVIALNTSDIKDLNISDGTRPIYISSTQVKWFAETIDLSAKSDAAEWSILILSHAPLDWGLGCICLCDILKAYIDGTSGSVTTVGDNDQVTISYDYAGKNAATIIGNCHGHNHNYKVDNLRKLVSGSTSTTEPIDIVRFCIPNACFERTNERGENGLESGSDDVFDIEYGEATSQEKVAGTAKDTAFCVVTIDPVSRRIYAHYYGAGYDREIRY